MPQLETVSFSTPLLRKAYIIELLLSLIAILRIYCFFHIHHPNVFSVPTFLPLSSSMWSFYSIMIIQIPPSLSFNVSYASVSAITCIHHLCLCLYVYSILFVPHLISRNLPPPFRMLPLSVIPIILRLRCLPCHPPAYPMQSSSHRLTLYCTLHLRLSMWSCVSSMSLMYPFISFPHF